MPFRFDNIIILSKNQNTIAPSWGKLFFQKNHTSSPTTERDAATIP